MTLINKKKNVSKFKKYCSDNNMDKAYLFYKWCRKNGCNIKVESKYKKFYINEIDLRFKIGIPDNYISTSKNSFYSINLIMKQLYKSHPHLNDIQEFMKLKIIHKKKTENKIIYEIVKVLGKNGSYNRGIKMQDGKMYIPDYMYGHPDNPEIPLFIIEVKENYHYINEQPLKDNIREQEIEALYGRPILIFVKGESETDMRERINEMKEELLFYQRTYIREKIKKEMPDAYSLAEDFNIDITDKDIIKNPFLFPLKKIKMQLNIRKNSEIDKRIDSYFGQDTSILINPDNSNSDSESDSDESDWDDSDEDEFKKIEVGKENEAVENKITSFKINIDYKIQVIDSEQDYLLTRKAVMEIAMKTDTPEGKKIFEQLFNYEIMLKKMIEIDMERCKKIFKFTYENRLKRAYSDRLKIMLKTEYEKKYINFKKIINNYLNIIKKKKKIINNLENENKKLKERIKELENQ